MKGEQKKTFDGGIQLRIGKNNKFNIMFKLSTSQTTGMTHVPVHVVISGTVSNSLYYIKQKLLK